MAEQGEPASNADSGNDVVATFCEGLQNRSNEELLGLLEKARDLLTTSKAIKESSWVGELSITEAVVKAEEGAHRKYEAILDEILRRGLLDDLARFSDEDLKGMLARAAEIGRTDDWVTVVGIELRTRQVGLDVGQCSVSAATGEWPSRVSTN